MPLDSESEHLLAVMNAAGAIDLATLTPAEARRLRAARRPPPGRPLHDVAALTIPAPHPIPTRLYRPSAETGLRLLLFFHGGGMVLGDLDSHDWICRELCHHAGVLVLAVDYRLAPEHPFPAAIEDAAAALGWTAAHAGALGADPARVMVGGDSAGGLCAAVACLLARDAGGPAVHAQLLVYPDTDPRLQRTTETEMATDPVLGRRTLTWFRQHYFTAAAQYDDFRANALNAASHAGLPPACVLTAEVDPLRHGAEAYADALAAAGVLVLRRRYPGTFHGFFTAGPILTRTRQAIADAAWFLRHI